MMQTKNKLIGASFEQSKRIVKDDILTEEGAQMGVLSSMSFWKRLSGLVMAIFSIVIYGVGVYMPDEFRKTTENVRVISSETGSLIGELGYYVRSLVIILLIAFVVLTILNVLPKINFAHQLLYGTVILWVMLMLTVVSTLPFLIGITIGAFGWIVFVLQLVLCVSLFNKFVISKIVYLKDCLYDSKKVQGDEWIIRFSRFIRKYGGILIGLSILNRWTFKFGENIKDNPQFLFILSGCLFLFFAAILLYSLGILIAISAKTFYFFKYQKEYREYFNITNEQWYGKFRARFMSKQK